MGFNFYLPKLVEVVGFYIFFFLNKAGKGSWVFNIQPSLFRQIQAVWFELYLIKPVAVGWGHLL